MFKQIEIKKDIKKCPQCQNSMEWVGGKVDETEQEYMCKPCRIYVTIIGFTKGDQEEIAEQAFD